MPAERAENGDLYLQDYGGHSPRQQVHTECNLNGMQDQQG